MIIINEPSSKKGWVKIYREILDKAIWKGSLPEQKAILITVLLMANHREHEWEWQGKKHTLKPGQFITSLQSLAEISGTSLQNVRTALKKFKKYGFLTDEPTGTGRLINVVNWGLYQGEHEEPNTPANKRLTNAQQTPNKRLTPNKNDNNDNNDKKYNNTPPPPKGEGARDQCESLSVKTARGTGTPVDHSMTIDETFNLFWEAYPRQQSKGSAERVWGKLKPSEELFQKIMSAIAVAKTSVDWTRENGRFVPNPAKWLREKGWEDKLRMPTKEPVQEAVRVGHNRFANFKQRDWDEEKMKKLEKAYLQN